MQCWCSVGKVDFQCQYSVSAASVQCLRTSNHWRRAEGQTIGGVGQVYLSPGRPGAALNSDLLRCKTSGTCVVVNLGSQLSAHTHTKKNNYFVGINSGFMDIKRKQAQCFFVCFPYEVI